MIPPGSCIAHLCPPAAFHFEFGALDNARNEVADAYHNMFSDSNLHPSLFSTLLRATWRWLPGPIAMWMEHLPTREYKRFRRTLRTINTVSAKLVDEKTEEAKEAEIEKSKKDVMSVLGVSHRLCLVVSRLKTPLLP